jgi:hypothetical protein
VDAEHIAKELAAALTNLDITDLDGRAGRQPWGYVEPTDAALEVLRETVQPFISNIARLAVLGHVEAACAAGRGTIAGLHAARENADDDALLGWDPDFLDETAAEVLSELRRALGRRREKDSMLEQVIAEMEDWPELGALIRRRR